MRKDGWKERRGKVKESNQEVKERQEERMMKCRWKQGDYKRGEEGN